MKILILLFLIIVPFSFQKIQAAFYCEDTLPNVYLIDPSTGNLLNIGSGTSPGWEYPNIFTDLEAEQGDKIQINCDINIGGDTYGGGCFLINNNCHCYDFNTRVEYFETVNYETELDDKPCHISLRRSHVPDGIYPYIYKIP